MVNRTWFRAVSIFALLVTVLGGAPDSADSATDCTAGQTSALFSFTSGMQTSVVPASVTTAVVHVKGAQGGDAGAAGDASAGGTGGLGASVTGTLALTPGATLNVFVGGQGGTPTGGFNGGAAGGIQKSGGGGGASDIRLGGTAVSDRVVTAGGGGGGGRGGCLGIPSSGIGGNGGEGGGGNGGNGGNSPTPSYGGAGGGAGAVGSAGGSGGFGCSCCLGQQGSAASGSIGGKGGDSVNICTVTSAPGGGGGGGGFVGGGGGGGGSAGTTACTLNTTGAGGGGAGGTNDTSHLTDVTATNGVQSGNGLVEICYINRYTVTFDANGGTGSMSSQSSNYNTTAALTSNAFTLTGYTFAGWNTQSGGGGTSYANGANYTFTADVTLYAQWTINSYSVSGNTVTAGGTIECAPLSVLYLGSFSCNICRLKGYDLTLLSDNSTDKTSSCTVNGNCYTYAAINVSADHTVQATYQNYPVIILRGLNFDTFGAIQSAASAATQNNDRIQVQSGAYIDDVNFDHTGVVASIEGGFNPDFSGPAGETIIGGKLTITSGTLTVQEITIE